METMILKTGADFGIAVILAKKIRYQKVLQVQSWWAKNEIYENGD